MSDAQIRRLERRWRETGAAEDQAAWLLARLRRGQLDHKVFKPAAILGNEAARLVMAEEGLGIIAEGVTIPSNRVFMALACVEREQWTRALIALLRLLPNRGRLHGVLAEAELLLNENAEHDLFHALGTANIPEEGSPSDIPTWFMEMFCVFLRPVSEDASWDVLQNILPHLARLDTAKDEAPMGWEVIADVIRDDLVPRLFR